MRVSPISNTHFKSLVRSVIKEKGASNEDAIVINPAILLTSETVRNFFSEHYEMVYRNDTAFFRPMESEESFNWNTFLTDVTQHFKEVRKVNVYDFACSDGSETYSLISGLISRVGESEAQKYFPIDASDIDDFVISKAKTGVLTGVAQDIMGFIQNLGEKRIRDYFKITKSPKEEPFPFYIEPVEKIKSQANFSKKDFLEEIPHIKPRNTLVVCRNFWPYFEEEEMQKAAKALGDRLAPGSLVAIGLYDIKEGNVDKLLRKNGFIPISKVLFERA